MDSTEELPEKIDKYEILGVAGRGAMGVVYHGHDPFFDRDVAIKTTQSLSRASEHAFARTMLFNEARAAQQLDHGAILQVFDAGEFAGEPYVVMEYVPEAVTLREHCSVDNLLVLEKAVEIIHTCARALEHAHRRGIIHRDIKTSNILLTSDGRVKIGDFGIAKIDAAEITEILGTVGSPRFMSPEQFMERPLTRQTDIYSLGAVLYELLAGRPSRAARFRSWPARC
jgi:serine/threonine protein kinase